MGISRGAEGRARVGGEGGGRAEQARGWAGRQRAGPRGRALVEWYGGLGMRRWGQRQERGAGPVADPTPPTGSQE